MESKYKMENSFNTSKWYFYMYVNDIHTVNPFLHEQQQMGEFYLFKENN